MSKSIFNTLSYEVADFISKFIIQCVFRCDASQWYGCLLLCFPNLSKVTNFDEPFLVIGESILVNDHSKVKFFHQNGVFNLGEEQCSFILCHRESKTQ